MSLFYFLIIAYTINVYNYISVDRFNIFEAHAFVYLLASFFLMLNVLLLKYSEDSLKAEIFYR